MTNPVKAYWWNRVPNYGDLLSPLLLHHFSGLDVHWAPPAEAQIVGCGSPIDALADGWSGTVAGAGVLRKSTQRDLRQATVLGVRGFLTWKHIDTLMDPACIADPVLLACDLVKAKPTHRLGIMPHWSDDELWDTWKDFDSTAVLIQAKTADPIGTMKQIASCERLVTSSLHGAITADALAIPRLAVEFPTMHTKAEGGDLKWKDYGTSINQPVEFGEWQTPDPLVVTKLQENLARMFEAVSELHG